MNILKVKDGDGNWVGIPALKGAPTDEQVYEAVDDYLDDHPTVVGTFSNNAKRALIALLEKVAFSVVNGNELITAFENELFAAPLSSITAVFTQGQNVVYNTDTLDDLRQFLVVTAQFVDGASAIISDYTLSGDLDPGTATITVTYGGKSDTFSVTVSEWATGISAVFTQGSAVIYNTDSLSKLRNYLVVTATFADSSTAEIDSYDLDGELTIGTATITASFAGKTDTFDVTVTEKVVDPDLLYEIENASVSGKNTINTGVKLYDSDKNFSICFDASVTSFGNQARFIDGLEHVDPWQGVLVNKVAGQNQLSFRYMNTASAASSPALPTGSFRLRFVLTHTASSGKMVAKFRYNDGTVTSKTISGTHSNKNYNIYLGTWDTGTAALLWTGTVNVCRLYSKVVTAEEITEFLGA